jgi:hypothetical protein
MKAFGGAELFESDHSEIIEALTVEGQSCLKSVSHSCRMRLRTDKAVVLSFDEGDMFQQTVEFYHFYTRYQLFILYTEDFSNFKILTSWQIRTKTSMSTVEVNVSI